MGPLELRPADVRRPSSSRRALLAGSVGNLVEWYEFGVYGSLATVIAANFFRSEGSGGAEALVATYASFALAFFFRPWAPWCSDGSGTGWGDGPPSSWSSAS